MFLKYILELIKTLFFKELKKIGTSSLINLLIFKLITTTIYTGEEKKIKRKLFKKKKNQAYLHDTKKSEEKNKTKF